MCNKKSLISIFWLIISLCVTISPLTALAAETSTSYTFEQLLDMNEDEISSISDECTLAYKEAESSYLAVVQSNVNGAPIHIVFMDDSNYLSTDEYGNVVSADSEKILEDLSLPAEIIKNIDVSNDIIINDSIYQEYTLTIKINNDGYNGHDMSDVYIKTYIALILNSEIVNTRLEITGEISSDIETTTTTTSETTTSTTTTTTTTTTQSESTSTSTTTENANTLPTNSSTLTSETATVAQTATSTTQNKSSSPKTGDSGVALALGIAFLSISSCMLLKKH